MIPSIPWSKAHGVAFLSCPEDTDTTSPLRIATTEPHNEFLMALIESETGRRVIPELYTPLEIRNWYSSNGNAAESILEKMQSEKTAGKTSNWESEPVIELVDTILETASIQRISDIHFESYESYLSVRFRKDGLLVPHLDLPSWLKESVILRLKVLANLDISEKRMPLDGRFRYRTPSVDCSIRISTLPTRHGEKAVLRLLHSLKNNEGLEFLGMPFEMTVKIQRLFDKPQGIFFVTGPTGSGKTSTLYAGLRRVIQRQVNVTTIEDPIEYELSGANQVQVNEKAGLFFTNALRSVLRQDPDVIFVGEIRDKETASVALQAAQTGHLVVSTLHTNDAVSAITRLKDLGISPTLIADAVIGILAQRLLRKSCSICGDKKEGCKDCNFTGYSGRFAIFELLEASPKLNELILNSSTNAEILKEIPFLKLRDHAELAVKNKETSKEELERVLG